MLTAECGCANACCEGGQKKASPARPAAAPLPVPDRSFFEQRLGGDFGGVRIAPESAMATAMRARAVTHGDRIDVAPGEWQPSTPSGRRLIAHELTHVLQQRGGVATAPGPAHEAEADAVAGAALDGRRVAGPLLGAARGAAQMQSGPGPAVAAGTTGTAGTATTAPVCAKAVPLRDAALKWLRDALSRLYRYAADLTIPGGPGPDPHVAASVTATFRTDDSLYVQVIASRLAHLEFALRTGIVTIDCAVPNDPHCAGRAAYTDSTKSYAVVMCDTFNIDAIVATLIHELAHTALPEVGIRRGRDEPRNVRDRAESNDRLIGLLSPEEALNNAQSYALLVRMLNSAPGLTFLTATKDKLTGCSKDPEEVLRAIARVERALKDTRDSLREFATGVNSLPHPALTAAGITNVAGVQTAQLVLVSALSILGSPVAIECVPGGGCATASHLGYGRDGIATTGATVVASQPKAGKGFLCPQWFDQSEAVRNRSMLALILLSNPSNMTGSAYTATSVDTWVGLAMALSAERMPPPTAKDAVTHMFRDVETRQDPKVPRPVPPPP